MNICAPQAVCTLSRPSQTLKRGTGGYTRLKKLSPKKLRRTGHAVAMVKAMFSSSCAMRGSSAQTNELRDPSFDQLLAMC